MIKNHCIQEAVLKFWFQNPFTLSNVTEDSKKKFCLWRALAETNTEFLKMFITSFKITINQLHISINDNFLWEKWLFLFCFQNNNKKIDKWHWFYIFEVSSMSGFNKSHRVLIFASSFNCYNMLLSLKELKKIHPHTDTHFKKPGIFW